MYAAEWLYWFSTGQTSDCEQHKHKTKKQFATVWQVALLALQPLPIPALRWKGFHHTKYKCIQLKPAYVVLSLQV